MTWLVVKFDAENTVEAVPDIWYIRKESKCYWPPKSTATNIIVDFIRRKHSPEANWTLYGASILGSYGKVSNIKCFIILVAHFQSIILVHVLFCIYNLILIVL